ncbi:hypothetical protein [Streptomyces sp. NPDC088137]|uniref:hypothetical protein n=1 Tax=Streptomyces sp. NPDC088137 TaxID=3365827 RepID=UPI003813384E
MPCPAFPFTRPTVFARSWNSPTSWSRSPTPSTRSATPKAPGRRSRCCPSPTAGTHTSRPPACPGPPLPCQDRQLVPGERARGLTEGGGFVALFDASTGTVTAVREDEHHLSDLRTAAAGAVCARALSRPDSTRATILGTGRQAELQARALTLVRPVRQLRVWGRRHRRAAALADRLGQDLPHVDVTPG